jgi:hypothetical protein
LEILVNTGDMSGCELGITITKLFLGFMAVLALIAMIHIQVLSIENKVCLGCGRMPGLATYTRLKVNWKDRTKLSLLHRSGNIYSVPAVLDTPPLLDTVGFNSLKSHL